MWQKVFEFIAKWNYSVVSYYIKLIVNTFIVYVYLLCLIQFIIVNGLSHPLNDTQFIPQNKIHKVHTMY